MSTYPCESPYRLPIACNLALSKHAWSKIQTSPKFDTPLADPPIVPGGYFPHHIRQDTLADKESQANNRMQKAESRSHTKYEAPFEKKSEGAPSTKRETKCTLWCYMQTSANLGYSNTRKRYEARYWIPYPIITETTITIPLSAKNTSTAQNTPATSPIQTLTLPKSRTSDHSTNTIQHLQRKQKQIYPFTDY